LLVLKICLDAQKFDGLWRALNSSVKEGLLLCLMQDVGRCWSWLIIYAKVLDNDDHWEGQSALPDLLTGMLRGHYLSVTKVLKFWLASFRKI
jgi:hypothetical protein